MLNSQIIHGILTDMINSYHLKLEFSGAIHGYSRRSLWLEVASSNNEPSIVAQSFFDYVNLLGGSARIIRSNRGTENVNIAVMQRFFRQLHINESDQFSGEKSFLYGRSTPNHRIEA